MSSAIANIKFIQTASAIAVEYPSFQSQLKYKKLLDMAKAIGERTPERLRAWIETQAALASSVDAAIEDGDMTCKNHSYQLGNSEIAGAEVDRWRKIASIPDVDREAYYAEIPKWSRDGLLKWWKAKQIEGEVVQDCDQGECFLTDDLASLSGQKFGTIYADPPERNKRVAIQKR